MIAQAKIYPWAKKSEFDIGNLKLQKGNYIIVKDADDREGDIEAIEILAVREKTSAENARPIIKIANASDIERIKQYSIKKSEVLNFIKSKVRSGNIKIKIIDIQFSFDSSRINVAFTAAQRVDFRELVKDISRHFQKSIKMIQVGVRDSARNFGGIGVCGRCLCCASFLKKLESVTISDAKSQRLDSRSASRLSGVCGRLKCCMAYEAKLYNELSKSLPEIGREVITPRGEGEVVDLDILSRRVKVRLADKTSTLFNFGNIKLISRNAGLIKKVNTKSIVSIRKNF